MSTDDDHMYSDDDGDGGEDDGGDVDDGDGGCDVKNSMSKTACRNNDDARDYDCHRSLQISPWADKPGKV